MYPGTWAQRTPDKPAAIDSSTGALLTYRELDDRSNQLAQLLWARGLRPGDHVAIFMENNLRYFEVVWAALRSGLYLTTINRYLTGEEAGYILDNCDAQAVVTSRYLADHAAALPALAQTDTVAGDDTLLAVIEEGASARKVAERILKEVRGG